MPEDLARRRLVGRGTVSASLQCMETRRLGLRLIVAAIAMVLSGIVSWAVAEAAQPAPVLEVFTRPGCSHCARALAYLDDLRVRRPALRVTVHDVVNEPDARERLRDLATRNGVMTAV